MDRRAAEGPVPEWRRKVARELSDIWEAATAGKWVDADQVDPSAFIRAINNATPEEQAQAMVGAGPEGEEWARAFEDMNRGAR